MATICSDGTDRLNRRGFRIFRLFPGSAELFRMDRRRLSSVEYSNIDVLFFTVGFSLMTALDVALG
jgi:hypothetical protein